MLTHRLPLFLRIFALACSIAMLNACSTLKPPELPVPFAGDYSPVTDYLSVIIRREMKANDLTGLSIALIDNQAMIWSEGFGYADKAGKVNATSGTRYRAGSVSKLLNAAAVMQLHEQNRLDLDEPIVNYIPDFSINSRFGSTDTITLRSLLSHQSGLPSDIIEGMWSVDQRPLNSLLVSLRDAYMVSPTNTLFSYSNTGVSLSGLAVQFVTDTPYESYVQQSVLQPLRMTHSDFSGQLEGKNIASAYIKSKQVTEYPLRDTPAGGLNTSVEDLAKFVMAVHADGAPILSKSGLSQMLEVQNKDRAIDLGQRIALGWLYRNKLFAGRYETIWHSGRTIAHSALLATVPDLNLGVVVLSNSADNSEALNRIADEALEQLYATRQPQEIPIPANAAEPGSLVNSADLAGDYAGQFGLIHVTPDGERFRADALGMKFSLRPEADNWYSPRVKLGFLTLRPKDFRPLKVTQSTIDGKDRLVGSYEDEQFLIGDIVEPYPASEIWDQRLGRYLIRNPIEVEQFSVKEVHFKRSDDFYYLESTAPDGMIMIMPVRPLNDDQYVVLGTGRGLGSTVTVASDSTSVIFNSSGLEYERKN